jgi:hypothetical protein
VVLGAWPFDDGALLQPLTDAVLASPGGRTSGHSLLGGGAQSALLFFSDDARRVTVVAALPPALHPRLSPALAAAARALAAARACLSALEPGFTGAVVVVVRPTACPPLVGLLATTARQPRALAVARGELSPAPAKTKPAVTGDSEQQQQKEEEAADSGGVWGRGVVAVAGNHGLLVAAVWRVLLFLLPQGSDEEPFSGAGGGRDCAPGADPQAASVLLAEDAVFPGPLPFAPQSLLVRAIVANHPISTAVRAALAISVPWAVLALPLPEDEVLEGPLLSFGSSAFTGDRGRLGAVLREFFVEVQTQT